MDDPCVYCGGTGVEIHPYQDGDHYEVTVEFCLCTRGVLLSRLLETAEDTEGTDDSGTEGSD